MLEKYCWPLLKKKRELGEALLSRQIRSPQLSVVHTCIFGQKGSLAEISLLEERLVTTVKHGSESTST